MMYEEKQKFLLRLEKAEDEIKALRWTIEHE